MKYKIEEFSLTISYKGSWWGLYMSIAKALFRVVKVKDILRQDNGLELLKNDIVRNGNFTSISYGNGRYLARDIGRDDTFIVQEIKAGHS